MAEITKPCFTDLTEDGQLYEILSAIKEAGPVTISGTSPIQVSTVGLTSTVSIADAAADGATKGAATFTAADFSSASGVISIDYTNGQSASSSNKGFLTSADWSTFNTKTRALTLGHGSTTLAAGGTNEYFSNIFDLAPTTIAARRQFKVSTSGTITSASLSFYNGGGAVPSGHSGATISLYNVDTSSVVATIISYNVNGTASTGSASFTATGLNITVTAGVTYNLFLQAGTFTINPTSVRQTINIMVQ